MPEPQAIKLTRSQLQQLQQFFDQELDQAIAEGVEGKDSGHGESVLLRPAPSLGEGHVEVVILDEADEPITEARVLFPT